MRQDAHPRTCRLACGRLRPEQIQLERAAELLSLRPTAAARPHAARGVQQVLREPTG